MTPDPTWELLTEFSLPKEPDSAHLVGERIMAVLKALNLSRTNVERLKTAIAKTVLSAIEPDAPDLERPIRIRVFISAQLINPGQRSRSDSPMSDPASTVLGQRLRQGWGFFLVHKMEGQGQIHREEGYYIIELFLYQEDDLSQPQLTT